MDLHLHPKDITVDNARNLSRAGLPHDPEAVRKMADRLLEYGQLAPVELVAPEGWRGGEGEHTPEEWAQCVSEHGIGPVDCGEYVGEICPPGRINWGYCRHAAATLLAVEDRTSARWDGRLWATVAPAGLTAEQLEDRNLCENLGVSGVAYVDLGLAAHRLTADPRDGGRGEEHMIAASRLKVDIHTLKRLLLLPQLCHEARAQSRLHHRDPEQGITPVQAVKLARRPVEEQQAILREARDMHGNVTPKAVRAAIAPHQGRQGQPPGLTGAQIARLAGYFARLAVTEDPTQRYGVAAPVWALLRDTFHGLVDLDADALARLPGALGKRIESVVLREPER